MQIEVIVQDTVEALEAEKLGVDRLELVANIEEGGLTPSVNVMKEVLDHVSIPIQVMIRPHSRGFQYNQETMENVMASIEHVVEFGGNGIVFGSLTKEDLIDEQALTAITRAHPAIDMTFHRAFDEVTSQVKAYDTLQKYSQIKRILTSGGASNCMDGKKQLQELVGHSNENGGPHILPGSGLSPENIASIHMDVQADQYHFGSAVREQASFDHPFSEKALETIFQYTKK